MARLLDVETRSSTSTTLFELAESEKAQSSLGAEPETAVCSNHLHERTGRLSKTLKT